MSEPWERTEDETLRAYDAFCIYRDLGPRRRSLQAVHDELYGEGANNERIVHGWSSRHDWVARAGAYDDHFARMRREALEQRKIESKVRRIEMAESLLDGVEEELPGLDMSDLSVGQATWIIQTITGLLRAEYDDEPTRRVEGELDERVQIYLPDNNREPDNREESADA